MRIAYASLMRHLRYSCLMLTVDQTLDAAVRELNRRPGATMADIASAIGISRATLHRHFSSRDTLLSAISGRAIDRWAATHAAAGVDRLTAAEPGAIAAALEVMLDAYVDQADDIAFLLVDEISPEHAEQFQALVERESEFYALAQAAGVLRADVPARWISDLVYGLMLAARTARRGGDVAARDLHGLVRTSFLRGVAA